jgi:S1-C subfamily serine protease
MQRFATVGLLISALLLLGGCVTHTFAPGPGMSVAQFEPDRARCRLFARGADPGTSFGASGSPRFVAGAMVAGAVGSGIVSAVRQNADFNDCMVAGGWLVADAASTTLGRLSTPLASVNHAANQPPTTPPMPLTGVTQVVNEPVLASIVPPMTQRREFGVRAIDMSDDLAFSLHLNPLRGAVVVLEIERQGAGRAAGLLAGDVILTFNEEPVFTVRDMRRELGFIAPESIVLASVWRTSHEQKIQLRF